MTDSEIRALWRKHGGSQHGPHVETFTIPEQAGFWPFIKEALATAHAAGKAQGLQEGRAQAIKDMRFQIFALCEDTEEKCEAVAANDLEGKPGAFARGRKLEAKSIRRAIGEWAWEEIAKLEPPIRGDAIDARISTIKSADKTGGGE